MDEIRARLAPVIAEEAALVAEQRRTEKRIAEIALRLNVLRRVIHPACDALHTLGIINPDDDAIRGRCWTRRREVDEADREVDEAEREVDEAERCRRMEAIAP